MHPCSGTIGEMSPTTYFISAELVFILSGLLAMAGLGAAFLFVPLFYYLGVRWRRLRRQLCC